MSLIEKINTEIKSAMKARNQADLRGLRSIKAALLLLQTESGDHNINEEKELALLKRLVKQRKDSIETYEKNGRNDLANAEREELDVIQKFLPKQMSMEELKIELSKMIDELGVQSMKDLGKIMPKAMQKFGAASDGKTISSAIKELLG